MRGETSSWSCNHPAACDTAPRFTVSWMSGNFHQNSLVHHHPQFLSFFLSFVVLKWAFCLKLQIIKYKSYLVYLFDLRTVSSFEILQTSTLHSMNNAALYVHAVIVSLSLRPAVCTLFFLFCIITQHHGTARHRGCHFKCILKTPLQGSV